MDTTIRTYTPADLATLTLPGDPPGLLDGWRGPIEWRTSPHDDEWGSAVLSGIRYGERREVFMRNGCLPLWLDRLRLPLSRWEARARVAAWLEAGGVGREPVRARDWLDWPGGLEPWLSAALLHAAALRAVAGVGTIVGICADAHPGPAWVSSGCESDSDAAAIATGHAILDGDGDARTLRVEVPRG